MQRDEEGIDRVFSYHLRLEMAAELIYPLIIRSFIQYSTALVKFCVHRAICDLHISHITADHDKLTAPIA